MKFYRIFILPFFLLLFFFGGEKLFSLEKAAGYDLYEPGIFNPLGPTLLYGNSNIKKRPYYLLAYDEEGRLLEKSFLIYNREGRLIAEKIYNSNNQFTGEVQYTYDTFGNIIEEKYIDSQGFEIATKKRNYQNGKLIRIDFFEKGNFTFSRFYSYDKNQIVGKEKDSSFSDPFIITLENGLVKSIVFKEKNQILMEIRYKYENGNLTERIKKSGNLYSKCVYEYDSENRIKKYTYFDQKSQNWKKTKTIEFVYADQI
ncbi:MAG: hypothetical protein NZ853_00445 [Leptospiraceae bacterium]|nr:hypothetical protein [Leptospiraceae bacterium]MDW7976303.1 hypothetical protein [Leptospiraceae bacterium]